LPANRLLASATLDRLRHNAYCLVLDGQAPKLATAKLNPGSQTTPTPRILDPAGMSVLLTQNRLHYADHPRLLCAGQ
jgi:hypothetical protein